MTMTARTCAIVGAKGGTTKTSTVAALGHLYAAAGSDVVMIDLDPQASLTRRHGLARVADPLQATPVVLNLEGMPPDAGRLVLMPGGRAMEARGVETIERHIRSAVAHGSIILIDTPPTLGPAVIAALRAAKLVLVPCTAGFEALDGFADMRAAAIGIDPCKTVRALWVLAQPNWKVLKYSRKAAEDAFPGCFYHDVVVPVEVAAVESGLHHLPITLLAPHSRSATAYRSLAGALATDLALNIENAEEAPNHGA